jgi:outer membrane protein TolC
VVTPFRRNRATGIAAILVVVSVATTAGQSSGALTLPAAIAEALDHSPALQQPLDSVELAGIQSRLAASAFGLKVTPSLSTANGPTGGAARTAGVTVTKQLATGAQVFMNVSSYDLGGAGTHVRDAGYTVGFSQPLMRGFGQTATAGVTNAKRASVSADRDVTVARSA